MSNKRHKAVFTQLHNEPIFWPLWLKYYSKHFEPEDIFCIHLIKPTRVPFDDWLEQNNMGFQRLPTPDVDYCDFQLVVDRVHNLQRELLTKYEYVMFAEIDEFVYHNEGLGYYIDKCNVNVDMCTGFEIVQNLEEEPDIDLSKPILSQRKWWYQSKIYSKSLLTRIPLNYCYGFHSCDETRGHDPNPFLLLLHIHKMDFKIKVARNIARLENESDSQFYKNKIAGQDQSNENQKLEEHIRGWWNLSLDTLQPVDKVLIPDYIRNSEAL